MKDLLLFAIKLFLVWVFLAVMPLLVISFLMIFFSPTISVVITTLLFVLLIAIVVY